MSSHNQIQFFGRGRQFRIGWDHLQQVVRYRKTFPGRLYNIVNCSGVIFAPGQFTILHRSQCVPRDSGSPRYMQKLQCSKRISVLTTICSHSVDLKSDIWYLHLYTINMVTGTILTRSRIRNQKHDDNFDYCSIPLLGRKFKNCWVVRYNGEGWVVCISSAYSSLCYKLIPKVNVIT